MKQYAKPELFEEKLQQVDPIAEGEEVEISADDWFSKVAL